MKNAHTISPRRALKLFLFAISGSVTGMLAGSYIVAAFPKTPAWLLPAVACATVLLVLVAAYAAFHLATKSKRYRSAEQDGGGVMVHSNRRMSTAAVEAGA